MRYFLLLMAIPVIGSSCSTMKSSSASASTSSHRPEKKSGSPEFIETIAIKPAKGGESYEAPLINNKSKAIATTTGDHAPIEFVSATVIKYAILMNAPVEELNNEKLINFIDEWYGTKYRLGGEDKNGVDCSAFVQSFMQNLYGISLPRTSKEQYAQTSRIKKSQLTEGDLVFFHTRGKGKSVSHVGVYLRNNKFIHASSSGGVMISDLGDEYFHKRYVASGRAKNG
jgi:cell wall-associated NlpC family hydrolase